MASLLFHFKGVRMLSHWGETYWEVVLSSGRKVNERELIVDPVRAPEKKKRPISWYLDLIGSGDAPRIAELWLYTPIGSVALQIFEPYTAYQLTSGMLSFEGRKKKAQIIGRVDEKETGKGVAFIWDAETRQIYQDAEASVLSFAAWRPGILPLGALNQEVIGLRL